MEALGVTQTFACGFEGDLSLWASCLAYWGRQASPAVTLHQLKATIVSAVVLNVHRQVASRQVSLSTLNTLYCKYLKEFLYESAFIFDILML